MIYYRRARREGNQHQPYLKYKRSLNKRYFRMKIKEINLRVLSIFPTMLYMRRIQEACEPLNSM